MVLHYQPNRKILLTYYFDDPLGKFPLHIFKPQKFFQFKNNPRMPTRPVKTQKEAKHTEHAMKHTKHAMKGRPEISFQIDLSTFHPLFGLVHH